MQNIIMIREYKFILSFVLFFLFNTAFLLASGNTPLNLLENHQKTEQNALQIRENKKTARKTKRMEKRNAKVQKLLHSKLGQWLIRKSIQKAERKQYRQEKKALKGDKEALKVLKNGKQERFAMTRNLRLGLILVIIGAIAIFIGGNLFGFLGAIAVIVGLVFILLDLI